MIGSTITHYKIIEKLGAGGMGEVYLADDTKLNRKVALKFLSTHLTADLESKERFNKNREIFGHSRIKQKLNELSPKHSAEQILDALYKLSEEWSEGRMLDDDLTIIVIKKM